MATLDLTTEHGMLAYLQSGRYPACTNASNVKRLPEGFGGFVYRAYIESSENENVVPTVIVKHAEGHAARSPQWKMDQNRMMYEFKATTLLQRPEFQTDGIRTPSMFFYDDENHVLIMEDCGNLPSLKAWLKPGVDISNTTIIGETLGRFLAKVHNITSGAEEILSTFNSNTTAKNISSAVYFTRLPTLASKFGYTDDFIRAAAEEAQHEIHHSSDVLTIGDFWTGNVLVSSPQKNQNEDVQLYLLDLELSKPGTAAFDIGQMAAEMYCLAAFRERELGTALLQAFLRSYKDSREGAVDAAKVAIRIAAHFFTMVPGAWSHEAAPAQISEVVDLGYGLLRMGWERDVDGLDTSIVGALV